MPEPTQADVLATFHEEAERRAAALSFPVTRYAPLSGWRGEPLTPKQAQGPAGCGSPALRQARAARGLNPYSGARYVGQPYGFKTEAA